MTARLTASASRAPRSFGSSNTSRNGPTPKAFFSNRCFGLATVQSAAVEIEATVTPFDNGLGCTLDVHRVGKPRGRSVTSREK